MKKLFLSFCVLCTFSGAAFSEVILAPQWSEFCPVSYMTAKKSKFNKDADYWYNRRLQFDESLARCNGYQGEDLKSCYAQVTAAELNKNRAWDEKMYAKEQSHQEYLEYQRNQQTINAFTDIIKTLSK